MLLTLLALVVAVAIGFVYLLTIPAPVERWLQGRILLALRQHYQSNVQLENLHVTLVPEFTATADNLMLPNRGDGQFPPLIAVKHVTVRAGFFELFRKPIHLSWVKLEGLEIHVLPKEEAEAEPGTAKPEHRTHLSNFVIDKVDADGTQLYVLRKDPNREPLQFQLRHLDLARRRPGPADDFHRSAYQPHSAGLDRHDRALWTVGPGSAFRDPG